MHPCLAFPTDRWLNLLDGGVWEEGSLSGRVVFQGMPADGPIRVGVTLATVQYPGRYQHMPWRGLAHTLYRAKPSASGHRPSYKFDALRVTRTVLTGTLPSCDCTGAAGERMLTEYLELAYRPGVLEPDLLEYQESLTEGASVLFSRRGLEGEAGSAPFTFVK